MRNFDTKSHGCKFEGNFCTYMQKLSTHTHLHQHCHFGQQHQMPGSSQGTAIYPLAAPQDQRSSRGTHPVNVNKNIRGGMAVRKALGCHSVVRRAAKL